MCEACDHRVAEFEARQRAENLAEKRGEPGIDYPIHPRPYMRRHVVLEIHLDTNMDPTELGGLLDGTAISVAEFGKEHIDMPRYSEVYLAVRDGSYRVQP